MEVIPKKIGISCLWPFWLSLVVSHPRTPILNGFAYLLPAYLLTDSEFSWWVMLAKPYPVSGPTYMPQIPNLHHCISKGAHEVLQTISVARLISVFHIKMICFVLL